MIRSGLAPAGFFLSLVLAGCGAAAGHRAPPVVARAGSVPPAPSPPATAAPARTVAAAPDRELERVLAAVAALRTLPFRRAVSASPQSRDQFRQVVREEIGRDLGPEKNLAISRSLAHAGFLPRPIDLAATLEEAETTQVAAYYDPRTEQFHTVSVTGGAAEREVVIAHELTHALQDQHFGLVDYDGGPGNAQNLSEDERAARRFVVEGEATFVMLAYQAGSGQGAARSLGPLQVAGVRMSLTMLAAIDYVEMLATVRTGAGADKLDGETRVALDALANLPPLNAVSLVDPYIRGAFLVSEAWARGGWARVAALYRDPPRSTEQALHPIEKLLDGRDPPIIIRLPPPAETAAAVPALAGPPLLQQTIGELDWRCYFKTWDDPAPELAAAGWGGDLLTVWQRGGKDAGVVATIATRWDSELAATRFEQAYRRSLRRRFPPAPGARRGRAQARGEAAAPPGVAFPRPDGTTVIVERHELDVDIIDGARPSEAAALLAMLRAANRGPR